MEITERPDIRARRYRRTAAHLRQEAEAPDRRQERVELLTIADQYDRLAERLARACVKNRHGMMARARAE